MAPAFCSRSSGASCEAREASTTALYSAAFLSGLNRILKSCSRIGGGQMPADSSPAQASICACTARFFSMAASACCTISAGALRKRPLPARRK